MMERLKIYQRLASNHTDRRDDSDHWKLAGMLEKAEKILAKKRRLIKEIDSEQQA